jgi:voltage-gated potassium channel Kch
MVLKFLVMFAIARLFGAGDRASAATATALAQGGEFAFVLLTFTVGAGIIPTQLAALLTATVAVSMAMTPLAMAAFELIAAKLDVALPDIQQDDPTFDEREPDIIIAGYGRFGQVVGRFLGSAGYKSVVLDSDIDQIETLQKFGRPVHYGDATRLDLLHAAGAERASLLVIALDDREKAVDLAKTARLAFPNLTILGRAWDRRHAYDLLANGADEVERETFESAIAMGTTALKRLGYRAHRAHRAAAHFRRHDRRMFEELAPVWGQSEAYILAARDAAQTMERLLQADLERMKPLGQSAWDARSRESDPKLCGPTEDANRVIEPGL